MHITAAPWRWLSALPVAAAPTAGSDQMGTCPCLLAESFCSKVWFLPGEGNTTHTPPGKGPGSWIPEVPLGWSRTGWSRGHSARCSWRYKPLRVSAADVKLQRGFALSNEEKLNPLDSEDVTRVPGSTGRWHCPAHSPGCATGT